MATVFRTLPLRLLPPLAAVGVAAADVSEDFDGGWSDSAYSGISTWNHAGVGTWESQDALVATDKPRSGSYVRLQNGGSPYLEFQGTDGNGVDGGIGTVSFWYRHWDGDGSSIPFALETNTGGAGWVEAATGAATGTDYQRFSHTLDLTGDNIRVRIRPTATPERLLIDDFSLTAPGGGATLAFDAPTSVAAESAGTFRIPVSLSIPGTATVQVSIAGGTAEVPADVQLLTPSLDFTAAQPTAEVELNLVDDASPESAETVELVLSAPDGAVLGQATHVLTIADNDSVGSGGGALVIVSANTTSGNLQQYEDPGDRIFQALQPDIVGIQEFNVPDAGGRRAWVDRVFGPEFDFMVEPGNDSIPCGVVSRYPILASGEWQDPQVGDRDFAWASIDIPGPSDLHVISVHLHGSGGSSSRNIEAGVIVDAVTAQFPADDYIVLTGDFNTTSRTEACVTTFKAIFSDARVPVDQNGDDDTNQNRNNPYDWVMPNAALEAIHAPVQLGGRSFPDGLVFDTRLWSPSPAPTLTGDSGASMMQHMAVVKAFQLPADATTRGTPYAWLESFGFTPDFEVADLDDPDGDGFLTWQEYRANTDPTDPDSRLSIESVGYADGEVEIVCRTEPGRRYLIEFADAPASPSDPLVWMPFADPSRGEHLESSAMPSTHAFRDDFSAATSLARPATAARFYRIGVELP